MVASNSVYTPKSNKKFGEKDSVTHCEPTILQIGDLEIRRSESLPRVAEKHLRDTETKKPEKSDFEKNIPL